jgi:ATP-binding cassette, subfamily B, bacterial
MAKRQHNFGASVEEKDKKKINKQGIQKVARIFQFVWPYRWIFGLGMIFLIFSQFTAMSFPMLMGQLIEAINSKSSDQLRQVSLWLMGLMALQAIFSFFRVFTFTRVSERAMRDVRHGLYGRLISLPISFFEKNRIGDLMSRITSDVTQLQDVLSITLAEFFRQIFTLLIGIGIIFYTSPKLALFMLATFPFMVVAAFFFGRFIRKNAKRTQDELAKTNIIVEETLQSISVVKAFGNEFFEVSRYGQSLEKVVHFALRTATFRGAFISFVIFALFGTVVAVVWYGGTLVQAGELRFGDLFSFILYTGYIGGSVGGLGDMYAQLQRTIGASERIVEIFGEKTEIDAQQAPTKVDIEGHIRFEDVVFSYPSRADLPVLKGLNLSIDAGQKVALVGASGAGKSTIAQLLMRFYDIQDGRITLDGKSLKKYDLSALRQNMAIVPQEVLLFGGTIEENIAYGKPNASHEEIIEAARQANALSFIESFPEGFQTVVGDRGIKLSGGQRQRIAIARAILKDPALLILDEATSALDSESEKLVQEALDLLMQNRTTLIIAHRLATIRNVDKIYVLQEGHVTQSGTHESLLLDEQGLYAHLVRLQMESDVSKQLSEL